MTNPTSPPRSLSGKALWDALEDQFPGNYFKNLHHLTLNGSFFQISYYWCTALHEFIDFLKKNMRVQSLTAFHDALKFFVRKLDYSKKFKIEDHQDKRYFDLVEILSVALDSRLIHEVKTREVVNMTSFNRKFRVFLNIIKEEAKHRQIWWFIYLRECKNINNRRCYKFLGLVKMDASLIQKLLDSKKWRKSITNEVKIAMEKLEKQIIAQENIQPEELMGEEGLFGVENQITMALREEIEQKMEENAMKDEEIAEIKAEKDAEIARKDAEIAEIKAKKDATFIEKDAEIARLKLLLKGKK